MHNGVTLRKDDSFPVCISTKPFPKMLLMFDLITFCGALACEPWLRISATTAKFPQSPPGWRYPMQRPSVCPFLRVESPFSTSPLPLFQQNKLHNTDGVECLWMLWQACKPTHRDGQIAVGSSWGVVSGSCSMRSMLGTSLVGDTCLPASVRCHKCQACWFATTGAAGHFLPDCATCSFSVSVILSHCRPFRFCCGSEGSADTVCLTES